MTSLATSGRAELSFSPTGIRIPLSSYFNNKKGWGWGWGGGGVSLSAENHILQACKLGRKETFKKRVVVVVEERKVQNEKKKKKGATHTHTHTLT